MAKRVAKRQINNLGSNSNVESEDSEGHGPQIAPPDVLASRKIVAPRRMGTKRSTLVSGRIANQTDKADTNAKIIALNQQFSTTIARLVSPNTVTDLTTVAEKYIEYYKSISLLSSSTSSATLSAQHTNIFTLNDTGFSAQAKQSDLFSPKPFQLFKGLTHKPMDQQSKSANLPSFPLNNPSQEDSALLVPEKEAIEVNSESSDDKIEFKGPQFTLNTQPTMKKSPFSLGIVPESKKNNSDTESEIELKGPIFTFDKPIIDNVFKFDSLSRPSSLISKPLNETEKSDFIKILPTAPSFLDFPTSNATPQFQPQPDAQTQDQKKGDSQKPSGSSTFESQPSSVPTNPFSFGSSRMQGDSPPFILGGSTSPSSTGVSQAFKTSTVSAQKPDSSLVAEQENGDNHPRPFAFDSFGKSATNTEKPVDTLKDVRAPSLSNLEKNPVSTSKSSPGLFNGSLAIKTNFFTSATSLSNISSEYPSKKLEVFNEKMQEQISISSQVGSMNTSNPESSISAAANKPQFAFDNQENEFSLKHSISTSDSQNTENPLFGTVPLNGFVVPALDPFSNGKSLFGTVFSTAKFGESGLIPAFSLGSASLPTNPEQHSLAVGKDNAGLEEESSAHFEPVAKLSSEKIDNAVTGEEDEQVLYTQRAKLLLFDPLLSQSPYVNKGLGELKVLKHKVTNRARILLRADGGLRVLLNAPISSEMTYSLVSPKMVRAPTINLETKKVEFFVFQVKEPEDAKKLLDALKKSKD